MANGNIRYNGSGYRDDTAFRAICRVTREERKAGRDGDNSSHNIVGYFRDGRFYDDGSDKRRGYASKLA